MKLKCYAYGYLLVVFFLRGEVIDVIPTLQPLKNSICPKDQKDFSSCIPFRTGTTF